jgi:hypothetical protein
MVPTIRACDASPGRVHVQQAGTVRLTGRFGLVSAVNSRFIAIDAFRLSGFRKFPGDGNAGVRSAVTATVTATGEVILSFLD